MEAKMTMKYLAIGNNAKTLKSDAGGEYLTAILYLLPDDDLCPMSRLAACQLPCLNTAGRGAFNSVQQARAAKSAAFKRDPVAFVGAVANDIRIAARKAARQHVRLAVRLNGTSDIAWENLRGSDGKTLFELFPDVQFYDYTKLPGRKVPANYHLTVSYSGANPAYAKKALDHKHGHNVAVVFDTARGAPLPLFWGGRRVIDGDLTDLRFTDPDNVIVGLRAKGKAKRDTSGFVVRLVA
jgi:hypothetical protein